MANVDFGHTDPIWTVPQGTAVRVDPTAQAITLTEPARHLTGRGTQ